MMDASHMCVDVGCYACFMCQRKYACAVCELKQGCITPSFSYILRKTAHSTAYLHLSEL